MAYGYHFSHSNAHITAISSSTPSSTACPVGVQFLPWKRGGSALRSSTTTYCGMLLWSREHRSSMTMYIPSIDKLPRWGSRVLTVSFPSPAQPLNLCMTCEEKIHYDFPCFVASFISLFILKRSKHALVYSELCLRNARAFPLLPAALASVPFGFVLVRVRVLGAENFKPHG